MFPLLGSALGYSDSIPAGKMFLINDNTTAGSFVYHHLIHDHLKHGSIVFFVGSLQSIQHHCAIQAKHGTNLTGENEQFVYIDVMKLCQENDMHVPDLKKIADSIQLKLEIHKQKRIFLVIEDISIFVLLGENVLKVVNFAKYCKALVQPNTGSSNCMAVLVHSDKDNDEEMTCLYNYLSDLSDTVVEVKKLSAGYFNQVDGEISVKHLDDFKGRNDFRIHYKLDERNLKLFAPGTSPTIL